MKVYQLAAYGNLTVRRDPHKMYSQNLYRTEKQARAAMPEFAKLVTTPKDKNDMMVIDVKTLRIFINPLELVNNKKIG